MTKELLNGLLDAVGEPRAGEEVEFVGADPVFPLVLRVGEAGAAAIAAAGLMAARMWQQRSGRTQTLKVEVDAAAAAMRSYRYLQRIAEGPSEMPLSRQNPNIFRAGDGRWIYLHREFAHHRARIADLLGCPDDTESVAAAATRWKAADLESAVFERGACAGLVRSYAEWNSHPQSEAVEGLPILEVIRVADSAPVPFAQGDRPLTGVRVLDQTRVLAGPTAARTLAEHGAEVLRIGADVLPNNELHTIDTGHGKRSTALDLSQATDTDKLRRLIQGTDVYSQSYRPGSLAARGFGLEDAIKLRPGIVYCSLSAFGHEGPWRDRRGFDTLVQSVSGISDEYSTDGRPNLLPVSALDYITGYLEAFGTMAALSRRAREGGSYHVRVSLAQTERWLTSLPRLSADAAAKRPVDLPPERIAALSTSADSPFGPLRFLSPVAQLSETPGHWDRPAVPLDYDPPEWLP